jgi:hypothetical protein
MMTWAAMAQEKHALHVAPARKLADCLQLGLKPVCEAQEWRVPCEGTEEMAYKTHVFPRDHIRGDFAYLVKNSV